MSQEFHYSDQHAPFNHILVKPYPVLRRIDGVKVQIQEEYIICAFCMHDISRPMLNGVRSTCNCLASCHAEARGEIVTLSLYKNLLFRACEN